MLGERHLDLYIWIRVQFGNSLSKYKMALILLQGWNLSWYNVVFNSMITKALEKREMLTYKINEGKKFYRILVIIASNL